MIRKLGSGEYRLYSRECARVMPASFATKQRAWGMPGARRTRSLACEIKQSTRAWSPRLQPDSPGIPAREWF